MTESKAGSHGPVGLARGLGWFSLGLGLFEVIAPRRLADFFSLEDQEGLIRTYGVREILNGCGVWAAKNPTPWVWGRVGGDLLDLATLATGLSDDNPERGRVLFGLAGLTGVTLVDLVVAERLRRTKAAGAEEQHEVVRSLTVHGSPEELLARWRDAETLSQVMAHFAEVHGAGPDEQHWQLRLPATQGLAWTARNLPRQDEGVLGWQSLPGATLPNEGSVSFRPSTGADRGTVATLRFRFDPPGGAFGDSLTALLGAAPGLIASQALRRFKSLVETGEIPTTENQPAARRDTR